MKDFDGGYAGEPLLDDDDDEDGDESDSVKSF